MANSLADKQQFSVNEFEGPLDLLLFLIKKNEVNIYDIPIKEITEQYIQHLDLVTQIDMDNITEFYIMATTLLFIKSRMLLPVEIDLDDELEDPRQELVAKLIEHQKFKKLSELMSQQEELVEVSLERKKKQKIFPFEEEDTMWEKLEVWDLLKTFSVIMKSLSSERIIDLYEEVSINEKISLINEFLDTKGEFFFEDLIINPGSIMDIVCSFLAILESVKMKRISIFQNKMFGDIRIKKYLGKEDAIGEGNSIS
ncbi:segregation and condensation protein A [Spirochaeta cellobiosiphila]|uniref:segregation and condensation protein A n=1 Tax=Spirochaeta cellobiosiphila TaxID=504483 RepID=UPI0004115CE7|nr:segregation/condensation protein A [Spirochaeta cellobiosiphila]